MEVCLITAFKKKNVLAGLNCSTQTWLEKSNHLKIVNLKKSFFHEQ